MELFRLLGTIAIDNSGANIAIDETTDKAEKSESKMSKAFSKIGSAAVAVGKTMAAGLAAGATAMAGLTAKALNAAGELEQNMGGSEAVFKDSAESMQKTAQNAFNKMGLSASDFLATANKMGALFQGAGFEINESADMSTEAMQRAADVASIMGIDVSSAMEAVAGMAKGNFTMMDNLGVAINDTTLQIFAQEKGLGKLETTQQKVNAAYMLFMQKSAYAAGNYAKENETLAGSMTTAKAAISNFLSGAGTAEQLAEALVGTGRVITKKLGEILPNLVSGVKQLITQLTPHIPEMLQSILPAIIQGAVALLNGLIMSLPSILQILINQLPSIMMQIGEALKATFPLLLGTVKELLGQIWDYISLELLNTGISFEDALGVIGQIWANIGQPVVDTIMGAINWLGENWSVISEGISSAFGFLWEYCQTLWANIGQPIWDAISYAVDLLAGLFAQKMPEILAFVQDAIAGIQDTWENHLKPTFDAIGNFLNTYLKPAFEFVFKTIIAPLIDHVFGSIKDAWNKVLKPVFNNICDFLTGVFTGDWNKALTSVLNIVKNIFNGILSTINRVMDTVRNVVNNAINFIKDKFNFSWSLPDIKLPHISISGDFSLNPLSVPSFGIDWYAKAMDEPMIMDSPTAFGINSLGQIMAGGEAGSEVVSGTDTLMKMISDAVASKNARLEEILMKILAFMMEYMPQLANMKLVTDTGALIGELAPGMDEALGILSERNRRGG